VEEMVLSVLRKKKKDKSRHSCHGVPHKKNLVNKEQKNEDIREKNISKMSRFQKVIHDICFFLLFATSCMYV